MNPGTERGAEAGVPKSASLPDKGKAQGFGKRPTEVRETDHYREEYIHGFVQKWDDLIDWDARARSEGRFFIDLLKERGIEKVLDVATGTGFLNRTGFFGDSVS